VANKLYTVEATASLSPINWLAIVPALQVTGDGGDKTVVAPRSAGAFFSVIVRDLDTDNDGVSDWAEQVLGLNPNNATSNGQLDRNGLPISDKDWTNAQLAQQGTITITAVDSIAVQPADAVQPAPSVGKLKITRQGFSAFLPA
jgi:hypothetical protein